MKLAVIIAAAWLILTLQGKLFRRFWHNGLTVKLEFVQKAAIEGETAQLKEIITNQKYLPIPVLHVKFQMGRYLVFSAGSNFRITDQNYRSDIFSCMPWQEIRRTLDFRCQKRGYYQIRSVDLVSYDLFFLHHCVASISEDTAMYVYPGPADPVRLELPLKNLLGQILARQALLRDPFETQSVRPYQTYDPYKSVNWKATAHTGELMVNVYTPASSWQVTILLDTQSDRLLTDTDLTEESIRLCGSMAESMIERGIPVAVYSNGTDCLTGQPSRLEAGAGREHLKTIMELLSRVQVASNAFGSGTALNGARIAGQEPIHETTMEDLLTLLTDQKGNGVASDTVLYVLISPGQRETLSSAFDAICAHCPGSQWIMPRRPDEKLRIAQPRFVQICEWEVPYGHTQII